MNKTEQQHKAVILAGSTGTRMGQVIPKQFLDLCGKPMIFWSIEAFLETKRVDEIVVTMAEEHISRMNELLKESWFQDKVVVIAGGKTRQESSYLAIKQLSAVMETAETIVLIHDAARPFVSVEMICQSIDVARQYDAVEVAVPVSDTIAVVDNDEIQNVLKRDELRAVQTPQTFQFELIWKAHHQAREEHFFEATDDVMLVTRLGHPVKVIEGAIENIKITRPIDYEFAKFLGEKMSR